MRHQTGAFESFTTAVLTLALLFATVAPPIVSGHVGRTTQSLHLTKSSIPINPKQFAADSLCPDLPQSPDKF
jgi:hypothetical protein